MLITPEYFSITPSSQQGQVYGTDFTFTALLPLEYTSFIWDFGDGHKSYDSVNATHSYNYPGIYFVSLSAWTDYGKVFTERATIDVDYVYRDKLVFGKLPETFNVPGFINPEPFVISLTSAKIDQPHSVYLQVFYSKSLPQEFVPSKWKFLVPTWKFLDGDKNLLTDNLLKIPTIPIYNESNKVVGVKGQATFYYVDDIATGADIAKVCPLMIAATLSTQHFTYPPESLVYPYAGYSNNETVRAMQDWQITENLPTGLNVTENYIDPVYSVKWTNTTIPLLVNCESDPTQSTNPLLQGELVTTKNLAYPNSNDLGAVTPVTVSLTSDGILPGVILTQGIHFSAQQDVYFKNTDDNGNISSGYVLSKITPLPAALTAVAPGSTFWVTASTVARNTLSEIVARFEFPYGYPIRGNVYVSHPYGNSINKVSAKQYPGHCTAVDYFQSIGVLAQGSTYTSFSTPALTGGVDITFQTLTGTSSVYGMAYNPLKNLFYACDVDTNMLRMYNNDNQELTAVNLANLFKTEKLAPSHITIDRYSNLWISFFDDYRLVKFDYKLKYLLSAAPTIDDQTAKQLILAPPVVETDKENAAWACWFSGVSSDDLGNPEFIPMTSILARFDSRGRQINEDTVTLPNNSEPVSIAVDAANSVWIACRGTNSLMKYEPGTQSLTYKLNGGELIRPSYIALDRDCRVWIAHGYNLCTCYDSTNETLSTWRFETTFNKKTNSYEMSGIPIKGGFPTTQDTNKGLTENEVWGGLTTDVYDRVWLVNSEKNLFSAFSVLDPSSVINVPVVPEVNSFETRPSYNTKHETINGIPRSAQAAGDWTGNRWYQKYSGVIAAYPIYGKSAPFKLYDINSTYKVAKVNETFDCAAYFKSLALPEVLSRNTVLFDELFAAVAGDSNPTKESAGRIIYEKIANFVANRADLSTAEVSQLRCFAEQVNIQVKDFGKNFPVAVNRLIDIFSVPKQYLRGVPKLKTGDAFDNLVGGILNFTDYVSAGELYYLKHKFSDSAFVVEAISETNSNTFLLTDFEIPGLDYPLYKNYYVYNYDKNIYEGQTDNLIDWDSKYTTVSYNISSDEDWYGDGGLVETMFNNLLTKQLFVE